MNISALLSYNIIIGLVLSFITIKFVSQTIHIFKNHVSEDEEIKWLTFKSFINFSTMFSWTFLTLHLNKSSLEYCIIWSILASIIMSILMILIVTVIRKINVHKKVDITLLINKYGRVLTEVSENTSGIVQIIFNGELKELDALSDIRLFPGTHIQVIDVHGEILIIKQV